MTGQGIYIFHPIIAGYPHAKFPGVVVFSEIYQGGQFYCRDMLRTSLQDGLSETTDFLQ
jgi:hypothetical protein